MVCWYCYWGWPRPVWEIYRKYEELAGESAMKYGPAHVVWEDENFEDEHIANCLEDARNGIGWHQGDAEESPEDKAAVIRSLEELLAVPLCIRMCVPTDYDDENPENFPPGTEMVRCGQ